MKKLTFSCECGRKHVISRDENDVLKHEVLEPAKPEAPKTAPAKSSETKSLLDVIFGD